MTQEHLYEAILIRCVEQTFLRLFSQGKMNGTVHTCVGQEWSAVAFCGQLEKADSVVSNHRCHGHYISFTKDCKGLIAELIGKKCGTCGGIGSSQHLKKGNFYSNGIQGGMTPVAAGLALSNKLSRQKGIVTAFIGEGTLGEGVLYETMNIAAKWDLPLLIVCENNHYSQSTHQDSVLSGDIKARASAFSLRCFQSNTWDIDQLLTNARESIDFVRSECKPAFHLVETYRLNAHSKGDDNRDKSEIAHFLGKDKLHLFAQEYPDHYKQMESRIQTEIDGIIEELDKLPALSLEEYNPTQLKENDKRIWQEPMNIDKRLSTLINDFFLRRMGVDNRVLFIGEDVLSPYGGAFKISAGLSDRYPERVLTTPISEAAIIGIGNGLALAGYRPFVEIMFGDFITLCFDQIVNHASKFFHMYNRQANCPLVIRTPMGGRRGYGPTHSQTLDKFLIGIDNVKVVALNRIVDPRLIYETIIENEGNPVIVIENKTDYAKKMVHKNILNYQTLVSDGPYPCVLVTPLLSRPDITIVTYGGMLDIVLDALEYIFIELETKVEVLAPSAIHPFDIQPIIESVERTGKLIVAEEGSPEGGIGAEVIAEVAIACKLKIVARRVGALPVPIPSSPALENSVLPSNISIVKAVKEIMNG